MNRLLVAAAASALVLVGPTPAGADGMIDVADAIKDGTGDFYTAWVMTTLTTFKVGPKCWKKLPEKGSGVVDIGMHVTRSVAALAKQWTGDDWDAIESQNTNDRATNSKLVEPMVEAFKKRFSITVNVDGDDCDARRTALWVRYWSDSVAAATKYPPPSGKVFITINVSSKTREVTSEVSKDGTTFTFNAPKDIEAKMYGEKVERPFRQLASGISDDFAFLTMEATSDYYAAWVLTKLHTWKVGKKCYPKLADKDAGVHAASFATRDIAAYARSVGAEDWERETNRAIVAKDVEAFKKRFSFTVVVEGDDCDAKRNSMFLTSWTTVATALKNYPPKAKKVAITLTLSTKAKDVDVKAGKDGATFAITVPRDKEPVGWSDTIEKAFQKVSAKK